jgi:alanine racemase
VRLEIDLPGIADNFSRIAKRVFPARVMAVLKADAYGMGLLKIAQTVIRAGADRIGVAELGEAAILAPNVRVPVQVLSGLLPTEIRAAVALGVVCPVPDLPTAKALSLEAGRRRKTVRIHFKIDTGMGRMGIPVAEAEAVIRRVIKLPSLEVEGIFTHFANANLVGDPRTSLQMGAFGKLLERTSDLRFKLVHLANSDGINNFPSAYADLVRTGINLYGVFDLSGQHAYRLKPTLKLKTRLIARRLLPAGHPIGYGGTHVLKAANWVGTLPAGYEDGLPLALSNRGNALIRGVSCPIIGRISMDYTTVDLGACPKARVGDEVILLGRGGKHEITVEDWARSKSTHPYDILCALGRRVERVYLGKA